MALPFSNGRTKPTRLASPAHDVLVEIRLPGSGFTISEIEPRLFSFNNPFGACPTCGGIGHEMRVDAGLIVPDETVSLKKGAIAPWAKSSSPYYGQTLEALAGHYGFSMTKPWRDLPDSANWSCCMARAGADPLRL